MWSYGYHVVLPINGKYPVCFGLHGHMTAPPTRLVDGGTMAGRMCTVLIVCVAVWWLYCHVDAGETVEMKRNYLTKLTMLGHKAGLDTDELNKIALLGLISEEMNEGLLPRDQKYIRRYNIESVNPNGNYLAHLLVNSLSQGTRCQRVEGVVDFDHFTVTISRQRELEATYCVQKIDMLQSGSSKYKASSNNAINNGSNGKRGNRLFACRQLKGGGYCVSILLSLALLHSGIQSAPPPSFLQ